MKNKGWATRPGTNYKAVTRANASMSQLTQAANTNGIDPTFLAAIGIRESGFQNIAQSNGNGRGIFQIDLGKHPNVTSAQAFNIKFAANFAANLLGTNKTALAQSFPNFNATQLLQATAASYNFGLGNITGNPNTIDVGTTGGNYGSNVVAIAKECF